MKRPPIDPSDFRARPVQQAFLLKIVREEAVFVYISHHKWWMSQGKSHGFDRKIRVGAVTGSVRGICIKTNIGYEINMGPNAQSILNPERESPLAVPGIQFAFVDGLKKTSEFFDRGFIIQKGFQPFAIANLRPHFHLNIVMIPSPPPGRPAPDKIEAGKIIAVSVFLPDEPKMIPAYMKYALIVAVFFQ